MMLVNIEQGFACQFAEKVEIVFAYISICLKGSYQGIFIEK